MSPLGCSPATLWLFKMLNTTAFILEYMESATWLVGSGEIWAAQRNMVCHGTHSPRHLSVSLSSGLASHKFGHMH